MKKQRGATTTAQNRREYQHKYYREHKEKALAYQRAYNLKHKKKSTPKGRTADQGIPKRCLSLADLNQASGDRFFKHLENILSGRIGFTI